MIPLVQSRLFTARNALKDHALQEVCGLDIRQLRQFLAVADTGSFQAAAEQLYISRPAMSKSIAMLEKQTGLTLFARRSGGVSLTEAGAALLPKIRGAVAVFEALEAEMETLGGQRQVLRVGFTYGVRMAFMAAIVRFEERHPHIGIDVTECTFDNLPQLLHTGRLDIGCSGVYYRDAKLHAVTAARIRVLWGVRRDSTIANRGYISEEEIRTLPHCIPKGGSSLKCDMESILIIHPDGTTEMDKNYQYNNIFDDNMFYLCKLVEQGSGIMPIAEVAIPTALKGIVFVPGREKKRCWEIYAYRPAGRQDKLTQLFIDEVLAEDARFFPAVP